MRWLRSHCENSERRICCAALKSSVVLLLCLCGRVCMCDMSLSLEPLAEMVWQRIWGGITIAVWMEGKESREPDSRGKSVSQSASQTFPILSGHPYPSIVSWIFVGKHPLSIHPLHRGAGTIHHTSHHASCSSVIIRRDVTGILADTH